MVQPREPRSVVGTNRYYRVVFAIMSISPERYYRKSLPTIALAVMSVVYIQYLPHCSALCSFALNHRSYHRLGRTLCPLVSCMGN